MLLNKAPIYFISEKQASCETIAFGSKFVVITQYVEYVQGLSYYIRMFGMPFEDTTFVYDNNQSVLANTSVTDSTLEKKSNSISFYFVREGCERDEWRNLYVNT